MRNNRLWQFGFGIFVLVMFPLWVPAWLIYWVGVIVWCITSIKYWKWSQILSRYDRYGYVRQKAYFSSILPYGKWGFLGIGIISPLWFSAKVLKGAAICIKFLGQTIFNLVAHFGKVSYSKISSGKRIREGIRASRPNSNLPISAPEFKRPRY